jgi:hypothetical protein
MALALSGCDKCPPKQPTETTTPAPVFGQLHLANPSGGWASHTFTPPTALVLPARGRGVRVVFTVPGIRTFVVSLREPNGTLTALPQNPSGGVQAPTAGFFEIVDTNTANPTTVYTMYVRAPASLTSPAAYDIEVVTQSLSASVPNSAPMVVRLGPRPIFTVTVSVSGNGHVTSSPGGIQCGTAPSGQPLIDCTYEFGPGTVNLAAQTNDVMANTRFLGWTGNCPGGGQTCTLTLTGTSALTAVATFVPKSSPAPVFGCPAAPQLTGLRWIDMPQCDTIAHTTSVALCDTGGVYFCCQPASAANPHPASVQGRCGIGQKEDPPNCMHRAPLGMLRQPGGCYEVAP